MRFRRFYSTAVVCLILALLPASSFAALPDDEYVADPFSAFEPENGELYGFGDPEEWDGEVWTEEEGGWTEYSNTEWNLAANPDFEDLDATGWATGWTIGSLSDDATVTEFTIEPEGFAGGHSARLQSYSANVAYFEQILSVMPDTLYRVSCWIKAEDVPDGVLGAHIALPDCDQISEAFHDTYGDWSYAELYVDVGRDIYEVVLQLRLGGNSTLTSGVAYFDGVEFEIADGLPDGAVYGQIGEVSEKWEEPESIPHAAAVVVCTLACAAVLYACYRYSKRESLLEPDTARTEVVRQSGADGPTAVYITLNRPRAPIQLKLLIAIGVILRVIVAFLFEGHPTDIICFTYWADSVYAIGPANFYTAGFFSDYPPGYIAVLYFIGFIKSVLNIASGTRLFSVLVRIPPIIADVVSAWLIYKMAMKSGEKAQSGAEAPGARSAFALSAAAAALFSLTFIFLSSGWGQIDSILTLFILLCIERFTEGRVYWASVFYIVAVLIKPQALMFGPLFLVAFIVRMIDMCRARRPRRAEENTDSGPPLENGSSGTPAPTWKFRFEPFKQLLLCLLIMLAIFAAVVLPFTGSQQPFWFVEKYLGTATAYNYATINAFNLFGVLGGNWVSSDAAVIGEITYGSLGTLLLCSVLAFCCILYILSRKKEGSLLLSSALMIAGIFVFSHFMHERYIFPCLMLLLAAYVKIRDRRLMFSFIAISAATLYNAGFIYAVASDLNLQVADMFQPVITIGGLAQIAAVVYLGYCAVDILLRGRVVLAKALTGGKAEPKAYVPLKLTPRDNKLRMTKRDYIYVCALTLVYALVALVNLGSLQAPRTYWRADDDSQGVYAVFGERDYYVKEMRVFAGIGQDSANIALHRGGEVTDESFMYSQTYDEMYRWQIIPVDQEISGVTVRADSADLWVYEMAFFDENDEQIAVGSWYELDFAGTGRQAYGDANSNPAHLFDEPNMIPDTPSYYNGMYFDELYHARTAFEHLYGLDPYENSHPPLGKIFIMLGVWIFGMNAFGWRVVGTLFGIGMVPLMYVFAKRLLKKPELALFAAGIFTFDFMHFAQTRIATIDTYGVFFIILMYYYMYQYYTMNFHADGLKKTLKPLGLCGIFFALGCASKWICIYAGAGLAVIFFMSLYQRYKEHSMAAEHDEASPLAAPDAFKRNAVRTLLFAVVFFVVIPVIVYVLSYIPYMLSTENPHDLKSIWGVQEFMFNYHSNLTDTHPFQSSWWSWPLDLRPIWFYSGNAPEGMVSAISSFGNPIVWWSALLGTICLVVSCARGRIKFNAETVIILVGLASQFVPWIPITRATFIYHYFASVPFIILALAYMIGKFEEEGGKRRRHLRYGIFIGAVVLFALFYPLLSGTPISRDYAETLKWLPSWGIF